MDLALDNPANKQCYKCEQQLFGNLNIDYNSYNSMVVLWNKYQIFIYENFQFISPAKVIIPEYQIHHLLITNNYLLCLDTNGFVHVTTLKFKNPTQKLFKCSHQPREQGIKTCVSYSQDHSLSLKYDSEYFISLNKISPDFHGVKKVALSCEEPWQIQESSQGKHILTFHKIEGNLEYYQKIFKTSQISNNSVFIVISFDKLNVYGCLFDPKMSEDHTNLVKLYSCPSEICSIEISTNNSLVIGLKMGTIIHIMSNIITPEIAHLNTALHKFIILNNKFLYTDGVTLWQAEKVFSDPMFKQLFVKNVHDFKRCGNIIICTTFTKLIYTFAYEDQSSYLHQTNKEYNTAEELLGTLNNSDCLNRIFNEVERGKQLATKLKVEGSFITAMALTKRQEIMDTVILSNVTVHNNIDQLIADDNELTLPEDISQYFQPYTYYFQIMVSINPNAKGGLSNIITEILSNSDAELHVTLSNEHKILKTTSIKVSETNILIPLQSSSTEVTVDLRLVPIIPGTYDKKQKIWPELYKKTIKLSSEHFIRPTVQKSLICQKQSDEFIDLKKTILQCNEQYISQFNIIDTSESGRLYSMYVRLPENYDCGNISKFFSDKSGFMRKLLSSEDFLESKCKISFLVGMETVHITIDNDGFSNPRLILSCGNLQIATSMRNFFSNIVYNDTCKPGQDFINNNLYTTIENLEKAVRDCIGTAASFEDFSPLMEQFEKDIIGMLPV